MSDHKESTMCRPLSTTLRTEIHQAVYSTYMVHVVHVVHVVPVNYPLLATNTDANAACPCKRSVE